MTDTTAADSTATTETLLGGAPAVTDQTTTDQAAADKAAADKAAADKTADPAAAEKAIADKAADYKLTLPEKTLFDAAALEGITAFAKDLGLSAEAAQKLVERDSQMLDKFAEHVDAVVKAEHAERVEGWKKAVETDKELGGEKFKETAYLADKALRMFATPEFKKALNETGFGNHPELVRVFTKIGKSISEDSFTTKGVGDAPAKTDPAKTLYPTMN